MKLQCTVLTALVIFHPVAQAESLCQEHEMDAKYQACRMQADGDATLLLSCLERMVTECQVTGTVAQEPVLTTTESLALPGSSVPASPSTIGIAKADEPDQPLRRRLLTSDDPNYFSVAVPESDDRGDVNHIEFYLSIKYPLFDWTDDEDNDVSLQDLLAFNDGWSAFFKPDRLFFHYNGLYDFYLLEDGENGQYESSPVVSKRQNPGLSLEYDWDGRTQNWTTRYGYFHESNGQQLEEEDRLRFEFLSERDSEEFALSQVSRGWDYWQLRVDHSNFTRNDRDGEITALGRQGTGLWHWSAELRWYRPDQVFGLGGSREDDIWWDETTNHSIEDFDGLRLMGEYSPTWLNWGEFGLTPRLEVKTSQEEPFQRISYRASTSIYWRSLNLGLFYFDGYGKDPSTYHLRSRYWGLGLELR